MILCSNSVFFFRVSLTTDDVFLFDDANEVNTHHEPAITISSVLVTFQAQTDSFECKEKWTRVK